MVLKRLPRPRDPTQLGKLMVDIATGEKPDFVPPIAKHDAINLDTMDEAERAVAQRKAIRHKHTAGG